ncbi:hypothetical protein [Amycolatopsis antarctica]|uniref:hypothetical protein n=1 Tax=Amycolatopsis antarctica TaxID=1854586 RepID=UPI0023E87FBD|nr:hypothetical protein [Amycolatopsis antarctica]
MIVRGRHEVVTPPVSAWRLSRAWPDAEPVMVGDAGHAYEEPGIRDALLAATDRFAR